ncbi:hypothetical protein K469DRAFT_702447 [Zopfia rhizophila CBS 207.26]|uniref:MYND-type domain-containing protein n=1 Tax=Zopfia rhizophila CBS 207.26 TaxID=1314779 RepID=A0A6A6ECI6_9PEZI|nr:hypothetical protein K469DRAFT_702447 [Zopfia rhizophila CBS 207.26]
MLEHEAACLAASNPRCQNCGLSTVKVLQTPMSWLHIVDEPYIHVLVNSVCDKSECEMQTRQQIQDIMAEVTTEVQEAEELAGRLRNTVEILLCKVCGETNAKRCARCKVVGYCGKEHQKADWKVHKRDCASVSR